MQLVSVEEIIGRARHAVQIERQVIKIRVILALLLLSFAIVVVRAMTLLGVFEAQATTNDPLFDLNAFKSKLESPISTVQNGDRSLIVDRNGILLAANATQYRLGVNPQEISSLSEQIQTLQKLFPDLSFGQLYQRLSDKSKKYVLVKSRITPAERQSLFSESLSGLNISEYRARFYPKGAMASHVLGLVNRDGKGVGGVEQAYNAQMGIGDKRVQLTLDTRVQYAVEKQLWEAMQKYSAKAAVGIVMDVRNGDLLAMASLPNFDANKAITGIAQESVQNPITHDEFVDPGGNPLTINRAISANYELGSVFKLFALATALENDAIDSEMVINTNQPLRFPGVVIKDEKYSPQPLTLEDILVKSSNVGAGKLALLSGQEKQRELFERFGLLAPLNLELKEAASPILPERWQGVETVTLSYGYGLAISPLHLATAYATVANKGRQIKPRLIKNDIDRTDEPLMNKRVQVISEAHAETLIQMLRSVVKNGSGRRADIQGFEVAGKTGTAITASENGYNNKKLVTNFVSVFPASDPQYLVYVLLENPKATPTSHGISNASWTAAPVAGKIISQIGPFLIRSPSG